MPPSSPLRLVLASTLVPAALGACRSAAAPGEESASASRSELPFELVEGEPMYEVLPPDGIPAIDAPRFLTAAEAEGFMQSDEPVIGVVGPGGTAKAYSAWQLEGHEIVNDEIDGTAIAATW